MNMRRFVPLLLVTGFAPFCIAQTTTSVQVTELPKSLFAGSKANFVVRAFNKKTGTPLGAGHKIEIYDGATFLGGGTTINSGRVRFNISVSKPFAQKWQIKLVPASKNWKPSATTLDIYGRMAKVSGGFKAKESRDGLSVTIDFWGKATEINEAGQELGPVVNENLFVELSGMAGPGRFFSGISGPTDANGRISGLRLTRYTQTSPKKGSQVRLNIFMEGLIIFSESVRVL
jgi:hypothetical protein